MKHSRWRNSYQYNRYQGKPMCWEIIFGVLLVLWGFSKIIGTIFNIYIPIFGIIFGIILLYLGITMITGRWQGHWCYTSRFENFASKSSTTMGNSNIHVEAEAINNGNKQLEYRIVMGSSEIDLTHITPESIKATSGPLIVNIDTAFGKADVKIHKDVPVLIIGKSAFGKTTFPNGSFIAFGSHTYQNPQLEQPLMKMYVSTYFGETDIHQK